MARRPGEVGLISTGVAWLRTRSGHYGLVAAEVGMTVLALFFIARVIAQLVTDPQ